MMFAREQSRLLLALAIAAILIALTFARVDHAALFPPEPPRAARRRRLKNLN